MSNPLSKLKFNKLKFTKPFTYNRLAKEMILIFAFAGLFSLCTEKQRANFPYLYLAGGALGTVIRKMRYEKQRREGTLTFLTETNS